MDASSFRALACSVALALVVAPAAASAAPPEWSQAGGRTVHCSDRTDDVHELTITVGGEPATGRYALPRSQPRGLVVFAHGYGHTSASWAAHMARTASELGVVAVAMDYRGIEISPDSNGDGLPESRGWNVMKGAEDSIAAAQLFQRACRSIERTTLMGVSMGANTAGLALALARDLRRANGEPIFDYWIDVEGAVNVIETYLGARALAPANGTAANAKTDIEAETGGPIETHRDAYLERAVVNRVDDVVASGLKGAVVIHGLDDGLVPYNQAREIVALLRGEGMPLDMYTVGRRSSASEQETTATGYIGGQLDKDYKSPLAGHASEKSTTHIVMVTAFERLAEMMDGRVPDGYREFLIDGPTGTYPSP